LSKITAFFLCYGDVTVACDAEGTAIDNRFSGEEVADELPNEFL
jgi:hypothetical protein